MNKKLLKELEQYSDGLIRGGISGEDYMVKIPVKIFGLLYKTPDIFEDRVKAKIEELQKHYKYYKHKADTYVMTKDELKSEYGSFILGGYQEKEMYYKAQIDLLEWVLINS